MTYNAVGRRVAGWQGSLLWALLAVVFTMSACESDTSIKESDKILPPPPPPASTLLAADVNGDIWRMNLNDGSVQPYLDVYLPVGQNALDIGLLSSIVHDPAAGVLYAGSGNAIISGCAGCLYSIDMSTGVATQLLDISTPLGFAAVPGLARRPADGILFAANVNLVQVDPTVPSASAGTVIAPAVNGGRGLTFGNDGSLYMAGTVAGTTRMNTLNTATAAATEIGVVTYPNSFNVNPSFPQGNPVINSMTTLPDGSALGIVNDGAFAWYGASINLATLQANLLGLLPFDLDGLVWLPYNAGPTLPAPVNNVQTAVGYNSNAIGWEAGFTGNAFNLYWSSTGTMGNNPANADGVFANLTGTAFSHFGVTPVTQYFYAVTAITAAGEGPLSAESFLTATASTLGAEVIPYAPVALGSPTSVFLGDDQYSGILPIDFNFTFFGSVYTQLLISSNGFVTFDLADAGTSANTGCCAGQAIPLPTVPNNYIAFAWTDLDTLAPALGQVAAGVVSYETIGSPGSRKFVVSFDRISTFLGLGIYTGQLVLNETANTAEIHTEYANLAGELPYTQGVENAAGNVGYFMPGRAPGQAILMNEAVRFHTQ